MIQFKCPKCARVIKVGDDKAGVAVACPGCQARLKVPTPKAPAAPVAPRKSNPPEEVEEVVPEDDFEEAEAPRRRPARNRDIEVDEDEEEAPRAKKARGRQDEDDEDDDRPRKKRGKKDTEGSGPNLVSGIVYIVLGISVAAVGLVAPTMMELQVDRMIPMIFGPVAGLLIAGLGIFYLMRK